MNRIWRCSMPRIHPTNRAFRWDCATWEIILAATFLPDSVIAQNPIPKVGDRCPTGLYTSGNCCKAYDGSDKEVITREEDAKCPVGWYTSGWYCVNYGSD